MALSKIFKKKDRGDKNKETVLFCLCWRQFWDLEQAVHWFWAPNLCDFTFTFHFHALEKEMATHSSVLAWRIPGTGEPGGLPSMGSHRVGHDWGDLAAAAAAAATSHRNWEISGTISLHFKEKAPKFLERLSWVTKVTKGQLERPFIFRINYIHFKEIRKCLQFSKENTGREGTEEKSLTYFQ